MGELRYYKGKTPVNVILKLSKTMVLVERLDQGLKCEQFRCRPNLLWKHSKDD